MALDLVASGFEVVVADQSRDALAKLAEPKMGVATMSADFPDSADIARVVSDADFVINAVPGFLGFQTLRCVIENGRDVVDIAFSPEDLCELDGLAKTTDVTAIVDCGVAPGMSNVLASYAESLLDEPRELVIYVGGLPEEPEWPFEYKAVFSPIDVIEEYLRPARFVEDGVEVVRPALSDLESVYIPGVGELEAFNTDGMRTMLRTLRSPNRKEKTLRYPGHVEKIKVLRDSGFFSDQPIEFGTERVTPLQFCSRILIDNWRLEPGDRDITVMKVIATGIKSGVETRISFDLFDRYDSATDTHSMARVTGYTATTAIRMLAAGIFSDKGVIPPEQIGLRRDCVDFMLEGLNERGVTYQEEISV